MVKRTNDAAQEESKETVGFVAEDSKGDSVPFGTRLSVESLVCYTFMKQTEYGNRTRPFDACSVSVFCAIKPESVHRACDAKLVL